MAIKTFTGGSVLTASDTNTYLANAGLVYITSVSTGTAQTSKAVTGVFSATYDNYRVLVYGGSGSADINLRLTLGATATGYYYAGFYAQYSAAGVFATNTANGTYMDVGYANANTMSACIELENPFATEYTVIRAQGTGSSTTWYRFDYAGFLNNTTSYTDFTLTCSTGNFTGGTIAVYGYRKA
jgi:hypothetical protein